MSGEFCVEEYAHFVVSLPVFLPGASLRAWDSDTDQHYSKLVEELNVAVPDQRIWTLQPFVNHPLRTGFAQGPYCRAPVEAPTAVKARRIGVLVHEIVPTAQLLSDANSLLRPIGMSIHSLALKAIIWDRGLAQLDIEIVAQYPSVANLSSALEPLETLWSRHIEAFLLDWPQELERRASLQGLKTDPDFLLVSTSAANRRLPTYSVSMLLVYCPDRVAMSERDFERVVAGFVGKPAQFHEAASSDPVLCSAAGYEGQIVILSSAQYRDATAWLWRIITLRWALMSEAKSEASTYLAKLPDRAFSARELAAETRNLRRTRAFLEVAQEEADEDSFADDNFERAIVVPVWRAWNGRALADSLRRQLGQVDSTLAAMTAELTQRQQARLNQWLALLAVIQGAAAIPVLVALLTDVGILSSVVAKTVSAVGVGILLLVGALAGLRSLAWKRERRSGNAKRA